MSAVLQCSPVRWMYACVLAQVFCASSVRFDVLSMVRLPWYGDSTSITRLLVLLLLLLLLMMMMSLLLRYIGLAQACVQTPGLSLEFTRCEELMALVREAAEAHANVPVLQAAAQSFLGAAGRLVQGAKRRRISLLNKRLNATRGR